MMQKEGVKAFVMMQIIKEILCQNVKCPLKCSRIISEDTSKDIFSKFYKINTKDEQDIYLQGLLEVRNIQQRRKRKQENKNHSKSYWHFVSTGTKMYKPIKKQQLTRLCKRTCETVICVIEEYVVEEDGTLNAVETTEPGYNQESETNDILAEMSEDIQPTRSSTSCSSTSKQSRKRKNSNDLEAIMSKYLTNKIAKHQEPADRGTSAHKKSIRPFLESLEEDMGQLTVENLRIYKIHMLNKLNNLLNDQEINNSS
ncbi:hypothetical protein QE152_g30951 [Popillia japonica]|uniref:BESS domain-containing protein n=1 Tax=Popillia japonica TaxID=7064 RepID=A0AAW1JD40_POPJA